MSSRPFVQYQRVFCFHALPFVLRVVRWLLLQTLSSPARCAWGSSPPVSGRGSPATASHVLRLFTCQRLRQRRRCVRQLRQPSGLGQVTSPFHSGPLLCEGARLRSCIVDRGVRLVRTAPWLAWQLLLQHLGAHPTKTWCSDTPVKPRRSAVTPAAVAAVFGCVPRGQRAPLDADTYVLIDWSTRLVEPSWLPSRTCAVLRHAGPPPTPKWRGLVVRSSSHGRSLRRECTVVVVLDCFEHHLSEGALCSSRSALDRPW